MMQRMIRIGTVIGASLLGAAGSANAGMIVFDNSAGVFVWEQFVQAFMSPLVPGKYLDITRAANDQPDQPVTSAFHIFTQMPSGNQNSGSSRLRPSGGAGTGASRTELILGVHNAVDELSGGTVGPGDTFTTNGTLAYYSAPLDPTPGGIFFNENAYMGVQFTMNGNTHYGWIRVEYPSTATWKAVAWGYETTPNTAAVVPAPGVAVAGVAGLALGFRRRR